MQCVMHNMIIFATIELYLKQINIRNNEVCKITLEHNLSQKAVTTTFRFKLILYKEWERYCYEIDNNNSVTYCSFPPHHHPETGPQQDHPVSVYPAQFLLKIHLPENQLALFRTCKQMSINAPTAPVYAQSRTLHLQTYCFWNKTLENTTDLRVGFLAEFGTFLLP